jgi:hypothetical protein
MGLPLAVRSPAITQLLLPLPSTVPRLLLKSLAQAARSLWMAAVSTPPGG